MEGLNCFQRAIRSDQQKDSDPKAADYNNARSNYFGNILRISGIPEYIPGLIILAETVYSS